MQGETGELWKKLCEQAAVEQDPDKLLELTQEISRLLDEKEARLKGHHSHTSESVVKQIEREQNPIKIAELATTLHVNRRLHNFVPSGGITHYGRQGHQDGPQFLSELRLPWWKILTVCRNGAPQ